MTSDNNLPYFEDVISLGNLLHKVKISVRDVYKLAIWADDYITPCRYGKYYRGNTFYFPNDFVIIRSNCYYMTKYVKNDIKVLYKGSLVIHTTRLSDLQLVYLHTLFTQKIQL